MILAAEYVPSMYATVWALVPPVVAYSSGTYHKRGLQLIIRWNSDWRTVLWKCISAGFFG